MLVLGVDCRRLKRTVDGPGVVEVRRYLADETSRRPLLLPSGVKGTELSTASVASGRPGVCAACAAGVLPGVLVASLPLPYGVDEK